mmetsp:Transcript_29986/g.81263  ORF Transcript_29986/g.81263 Transcript_29986/m.81263 type:complete len:572 (+) Transcript_29986:3-1718(+)
MPCMDILARRARSLLLLRLRRYLHEVVDADDRDGGLCRKLEGLQLGHQRLEDSSLDGVAHGAVGQVQAVPLVVLLLLVLGLLRGVVPHPQGGKEVDGVQRSVHGQRLGDGQERLRVLRDRPLLVGVEGPGVVLQVEADRDLHGAAARAHGVGLHRARDRAEGVVHRALGFLQHEFVGPAQQDGGGLRGGAALDEDELIVPDALLHHLFGGAQELGVKLLLPVHVGHREHYLRSGALGDAPHVLLVDSADADDAGLHEVLHGEVVDALGGEEHRGACVDDLLDLLLRDVHLPLADLLQLRGVVDDNVHTHGHAVLLEVKIEERNLCRGYRGRHLLRRAHQLNCVATGHEGRLRGCLPVRLQHVHLAHGILGLAVRAHGLDRLDGVHNDPAKEVGLRPEKLGGERGLCDAEENVLLQLVHLDAQVLLDVLDGLPHGQAVAGDDRGRVDVVLHELVRPLQQLGRDDHHGGRAVPHLCVLQVGQLHQHLGRGVFHLQLLQNGGPVVGDGDVTDVVDQHLVQALRAQRGLQDVGEGRDSGDICRAHVRPALALAVDGESQLCGGHCCTDPYMPTST